MFVITINTIKPAFYFIIANKQAIAITIFYIIITKIILLITIYRISFKLIL